jgi:hypothetical protein
MFFLVFTVHRESKVFRHSRFFKTVKQTRNNPISRQKETRWISQIYICGKIQDGEENFCKFIIKSAKLAL